METERVRHAVEALLATDPEVADRDELADHVRTVREVRNYLDAYELRCTRRSRAASKMHSAAPRCPPGISTPWPPPPRGSTSHSRGVPHVRGRPVGGGSDDERRPRSPASVAAWLATSSPPAPTVPVTAAELDRQRAQANVKRWVDKTTGMRLTLLELDPVNDATVWSTIDAQLASLRKADGNARTPWQRMQVDAVVAVVGAGPGADRVPEIMVLSDYATLVRGLHTNSVCETVDGVPLPVSTVRRMCCDADIVPAMRPPRLHRRVLGVPDPPREVVVARSRRHRHRQSAPTVRTPPPPRPRRGLGPHDDPGSSRHLDPSGRHRSLDRHHHRPRTARDRHTPSRPPALAEAIPTAMPT